MEAVRWEKRRSLRNVNISEADNIYVENCHTDTCYDINYLKYNKEKSIRDYKEGSTPAKLLI